MLGRRGQVRLDPRLRRIRGAVDECLLIQVRDARFALGCGERQHGHVAVVFLPGALQLGRQRVLAEERLARLRAGKHGVERAGPSTVVSLATRCCMDCSGLTHGPPVPVQPGPALTVICRPSRSASRDACAKSVCHWGLMNFTGPRDADVDLHDDHAADAGGLHRFQIRRHPLAVQVPVHPEPVDPRPRSPAGRQMTEPIRRRGRPAGQQQVQRSVERVS